MSHTSAINGPRQECIHFRGKHSPVPVTMMHRPKWRGMGAAASPFCRDQDAWQQIKEAVLGQGLEHSVLLDDEEVSRRAPGGWQLAVDSWHDRIR